jgi:Flp pilus assembly protein TadD
MSGVMAPTRAVVRPPPSVPVPVADLFEVVTEYVEASRFDRAERLLAHVLAVAPDQADALHLKGLIAARRKRPAEAAALMERGVAGGGRRPGQLRNLSEVYRLLGRLDEALALARQSIAGDPADPLGPFNLAMIHYDRMEIDPCINAARHSVRLRPNLPQGHMKLGQALLIKGDFQEGWEEYEWRYQIPGAQPLMPATDRKQWDGTPLGDRALLLVADQGFGDVIMFARYIPWARERCPNLRIACSAEMQPTLARMFPDLKLFTHWNSIGDYAAFCPFSGLPRLHGTRLETIPAAIPYLTPDPARVAVWKKTLDELVPPGLKRIGIAWAGRPTHNNDHNRTTVLENFAPIGAVPGVALISLQKGEGLDQIPKWQGPAPLIDIGSKLESFEDTIAVIDRLDLIVSVDTSINHFAGAMGRPAWIMLPFAPDWRWLMNRPDTPWYPSLRLFRHPATRRWDLVVPAVAAELRRLFGV